MKEESRGKKVDQFCFVRFIYEKENFVLILIISFILSQWRDFKIGVIMSGAYKNIVER